jgi:DNA polymerase-4
LSRKALELFRVLYSRRMLIRLIGIKFSDLVSGTYQVDLFNDVAEELSLMQAMDAIRLRFGKEKIMRAACYPQKEEENAIKYPQLLQPALRYAKP